MKRGTIRHPKLLALARRLEVDPWAALGLLEALLDWAYHFAPEGNVGRFRDEDIADGIGWKGEAGTLIRALVATRWLDMCGENRLVIHDLADHADRVWRQLLARNERSFVTVVVPVESSLSPQCVLTESTVNPPSSPVQSKPDQTKPESVRAPKSRSRTLPATELLTEERMAIALEAGMSEAETRQEWEIMGRHEFQTPRSHWTNVWRTWCARWQPKAAPRRSHFEEPRRPAVPDPEETRRMLQQKGLLPPSALPFRSMP